ncbi:glycolipid anchored surface protein [Whalleya microplaca]|nr:glycolipid anchored surface protein [Whalleya microplaca]
MSQSMKPITINGRYFWKDDERFIVNGVVYQQHKPIGNGPRLFADPLSDEQLEDLERSIPLFKELGLNTIYVFCIDATKNHDAAMNMLAEAGIYVLTCVSTPHHVVRRDAPLKSYTADLLQHFFRTVDCMAAYPNTLGVLVANEVINSIPSTAAAPVIRAVTRDVKKYMAVAAKAAGQRILPVGVGSADVRSILKPQFDYFSAGRDEETIDFYAFNSYCWCGKSSMSMSGYNGLVKMFANTHIPVFFSEYGANVYSQRLFQETQAINSPEMTGVFSGGIVYELFHGANEYGMVKKHEDGAFERLPDFENLKASLRSCTREPATIRAFADGGSAMLERPDMPMPSSGWRAGRSIPESPVDWDEVRAQIEDSQWILVDRVLQLTINDIL